MKLKYQISVLTGTLLLATGCTNTLYQADLDVLNSNGDERQATLYWSKTEKLIGEAKAGPIILRTACSTRPVTFDETATGIVFRGTPGQDRMPGQADSITEETICGQVYQQYDVSRISELKPGLLVVMIKCEAVTGEFSATDALHSPAYIQAREAPYRFNVQENSSWSFFGSTPEAPPPPECK